MDSEVLTVKLLDLAEGRETPETWWSWWDEHETELETLLGREEFLKLKPRRHGFQWVPVFGSQKGAIAILEKSGTALLCRSSPGFPTCRSCWTMWNGRGSFPIERGSMSQSGIGSSSNASGSISKSSRIQQRGTNAYVKQTSIHLEWNPKQTGE